VCFFTINEKEKQKQDETGKKILEKQKKMDFLKNEK